MKRANGQASVRSTKFPILDLYRKLRSGQVSLGHFADAAGDAIRPQTTTYTFDTFSSINNGTGVKR